MAFTFVIRTKAWWIRGPNTRRRWKSNWHMHRHPLLAPGHQVPATWAS